MIEKIKYALYRFMRGRYGNDKLNNFLFIAALIIMVLNMFLFKNMIISFIIYALLGILVFRSYSRNIQARRKENNAFLNFTKPIRKRMEVIRKNQSDKSHKYYICPSCSQIVRVPKGRGTIEITCPKCKNQFTKKT